jgi:hypothetical protein
MEDFFILQRQVLYFTVTIPGFDISPLLVEEDGTLQGLFYKTDCATEWMRV